MGALTAFKSVQEGYVGSSEIVRGMDGQEEGQTIESIQQRARGAEWSPTWRVPQHEELMTERDVRPQNPWRGLHWCPCRFANDLRAAAHMGDGAASIGGPFGDNR